MTPLTRESVRDVIVDLRDNGKHTFSEIESILKERYGIVKTRQAVYGIYTRYKGSVNSTESHIRLVCDVIGVYSLGYSAEKTRQLLSESGVALSYGKVSEIIAENKEYANNVNKSMLAAMVNLFTSENDPSVIRNKLAYKDIEITDKKFNILLTEAYKLLATRYCNSIGARVCQMCGDTKIIGDLTLIQIRSTKSGIKDIMLNQS